MSEKSTFLQSETSRLWKDVTLPVHVQYMFKYLNICFYLSVLGHLTTSPPLAMVTYFVMCSCVSVLRNAFKHCILIN